MLKEIAGIRIGIIGITGGESPEGSDLIITDWREALHTQLPALEKQSDFLLLLSSLKMEENRELAKNFPQIDMLVSACTEYGNTTRILNQTRHAPLLVQVAGEGRMLGQLQVIWLPEAKDGWRERQDQDPEKLRQRINTTQRRVALLEKKFAEESKNERLIAKINREKRLTDQLQSRLRQIEETEKLLAEKKVNGFTVRFRKIQPKPGSQEIIRLVDEIIQKTGNASSR